MPTYVYECAKCSEELEAWQSFSDEPLKKHAGCGGKLTKVFQPVGIVFKGAGFHRTDSRSPSKRSRSDDAGDTQDSSSEKSDKSEKTATSAKADAKADTSSGNGGKKSSDTNSSGAKSSKPKEPSTSGTTPK